MKQLWKSEDRAMDRLLRGHMSQQSSPKESCKQFDPDLANAFIEKSLTPTEREGFQQHTSLVLIAERRRSRSSGLRQPRFRPCSPDRDGRCRPNVGESDSARWPER